MFWTTLQGDHLIHRANLGGSELEGVLINLNDPRDVTLNRRLEKLYWTVEHQIQRANLDGSGAENLVVNLQNPQGLTHDPSTGKVFWADPAAGKVWSVGADGANVSTLIDGLLGVMDVALDEASRKLYWADGANIGRSDLDGTNLEVVVRGGAEHTPTRLAVDPINHTLYWFNPGFMGQLVRSTLDGAQIEIMVQDLWVDETSDLVVDGDRLVMTTPVDVWVARLDGLDLAQVATAESLSSSGRSPAGLAVDPRTRDVYLAVGEIVRMDREFSQVKLLVQNQLPGPLAVDKLGKKLYWVSHRRSIFRSELNGTNVQWMWDVPRSASDLVVDELNQKIYWSSFRGIWRVGLDETDVEVVLDQPAGALAVDPVAGKLYWSDSGDILRADLDGSNVDTVISGLDQPARNIQLDPANAKLYWVGQDEIRRANLSGANEEVVLTPPLPPPLDLILDLPNERVFWLNVGEIWRANLDGTGIERVLGNLPLGLALALYD